MTDMGVDDEPLGYLLNRVAMALRSEIVSTVLEPLDLPFSQYICLRALSKFPGYCSAELARETGVSAQAMNMVLRALEERGLAARPASVASGRSLPAKLTRSGQQMLGRVERGAREAEQRLMTALSAEQQRDLKGLLAVLV